MKQEPLSIDMNQIESHVFLRLVNYERNREILADCPYIPFHDMAITFRYLVRMDQTGIASALINYENLKACGLSVDALYETAKENTIRLFPPFLMRLDKFLETRYPQETEYPDEPDIYILSNQQFIYGATMMIYQDVVAEFAAHMGKMYTLFRPVSMSFCYVLQMQKKRRKCWKTHCMKSMSLSFPIWIFCPM